MKVIWGFEVLSDRKRQSIGEKYQKGDLETDFRLTFRSIQLDRLV